MTTNLRSEEKVLSVNFRKYYEKTLLKKSLLLCKLKILNIQR